jgi:exportin-1
VLEDSDKTAIRSVLVQMVLEFPEASAHEQQYLLTKLNATLISIVKFEWRTTWRSFIPDICTHALVSQLKCENALNILRMMSEEIFDFSKNQILQSEVRQLKEQMIEQFMRVNELCYWVLNQALTTQINPSLVKSCLKALQAYLSWIPLNFIFNTDLMSNLIEHFILPIQSRNEAIKCVTEIASLTFEELDAQDPMRLHCRMKLCHYYCQFIKKITELTKNRSLTDEYASVKKSQQQTGFENFARQLALAISAVIKNNADLIEQSTNVMESNADIDFLRNSVNLGLRYMVQLSHIPEEELFKICLDFWHWFSHDVLLKTKQQYFQEAPRVPGMDFGFAATVSKTSYLH